MTAAREWLVDATDRNRQPRCEQTDSRKPTPARP